jgi:hypothetical protein
MALERSPPRGGTALTPAGDLALVPGLRAEVASLFAEWLGLDVERYTSLTTVEDDTTFVSKDGG